MNYLEMSDGAMHKTSDGVHTHGDGAMHTDSAGESDRTADGHSGMHARIGMPAKDACRAQDGATHTQHSGMQIGMAVNSACGAHAMSVDAMHKTSAGAGIHDDATMHAGSLGESDGIAD